MKQYKHKEFIKLLEMNGYIRNRTCGGHLIYTKDKNTISIPSGKKELNMCLTRRLIKENSLKE